MMVRGGSEYFAKWLSRTLNERELAAGEVARILGVNDSAVSRWRNGKSSPGLESVMKLAEVLDVDPIALTVTVGLMDSSRVGVARLPLPEDTKTKAAVRQQVMNIKGLTRREQMALIEAYEQAKGS